MESIFEFDNYREFLENHLHSPKAMRGTQTRLAKALGTQSSYIYQVLQKGANLTEDQAFGVTRFFVMSPAESDYFMDLVRLEKAVGPELRAHLKSKVELRLQDHRVKRVQKNSKTIETKGESGDDQWNWYFSTIAPLVVHITSNCPEYQTVKALSKKLAISEERVLETLEALERLGLVNKNGRKWSNNGQSIHIPRDSPNFLKMNINQRTKILNKLIDCGVDDNIYFSSFFTLEKTRAKELEKMIYDFVNSVRVAVEGPGADEVYFMTIDFVRPYPD